MAGVLAERAALAATGRDRVLDAAKTFALLVVMVGHSLAWHVVDDEPGNVLQVRPELRAVTWFVQVLALFFAAGAVGNASSLRRCGDGGVWLGRRLSRLLGPVLVYATVWCVLLLPLAPSLGYPITFAGRFLSQLLWFAGVYLVVVAAAPWTVRHQQSAVLLAWLGAIAAVDAVRMAAVPAVGWLNMLLVWGWLHQVGYRLPALRRTPVVLLLIGAGAALAAALALAVLGPYSTSMISVAGDPDPSNLAPPTIVVALHGLALILLLAAVAGPLDRALQRPAVYAPIAILGSRGIGLYLWHIPVVGAVAAACWGLGVNPDPLSGRWWLLHLGTAAAVIAGAWLLAGLAATVLPRLQALPARAATSHAPVIATAAGLLTLLLSATGFATWWSTAVLGIPTGAPLLLAGLWLVWRLRPAARPGRTGGAAR